MNFYVAGCVAAFGPCIEIVDIECVLGHESCRQFFLQMPL